MTQDPAAVQKVLECFRRWDASGSGTIGADKLLTVLSTLGLPVGKVHTVFSSMGVTADGEISYEDFVRTVCEPRGQTTQPSMDSEDQAEREKIAAQGVSRRLVITSERVDGAAVKNYQRPVYPKDDATKQRIVKTIKDNAKMQVLAGHLDDTALSDVVDAFQEGTQRCHTTRKRHEA
eukprot:gnl/TRDRNA2_/TRDRNA2_164753_c0_seq3.p1 gnl/TRDRNA2_/TRDRNA2_164753_c0~~gnl/TRDRNA2_/TRDRNA2_164753_c0_seq3.p1  ORF type:complete len:177 (-),score=29.99 gnl/TRDRNA2_/TRDRNA2_164753_c0_seq3:27-557(-)